LGEIEKNRMNFLQKFKTNPQGVYIILYIILFFNISNQEVSAQSSVPILNPGVEQFLSGDYTKCLNQYLSYLQNSKEINDTQRLSILLRAAYMAAWTIELETANYLINQADSLVKNNVIPDSTSIADRKLFEAIIAYYNSELSEASDLLVESSQFRLINNRFEQAILADTYGFLGLVFKILEDFTQSIRFYERAIQIDKELNRQTSIANELTELARPKMEVNPKDFTIDKQLNEALEIFILLNDYSGQTFVYNEFGALFQKRGNFPEALIYILESVRIKEDHGFNQGLDVNYNNIGALYENMSQADSSIFFIKKAIGIVGTNNKQSLSNYYYNLGSQYGRLGLPDSAIYYFDLAIKQLIPPLLSSGDSSLYSIVNPQMPWYLAGKATELYNFYEKTGDLDFLKQSLENYDISLHQLDVLRFLYSFENKALAVKENRKYYFLALKYAAEYYENTLKNEDLENAFLLAGRSKGLVFDEYLRISEARDLLDINPDLIRRDDSLKILKTSILQKTYEFDISQVDSVSYYESIIFNIDKELTILEREIKEKHPAYYQGIHSTQEFPPGLIKEKLGPDELLLDFTWHENQLIIFTVSHDDIRLHRIEVPSNLRADIGEYSKFLSGWSHLFSDQEFKNVSYSLYNTILKPIESFLLDKTLYIIPDDSLALLPFESLLYEKVAEGPPNYSKYPYLIKKNAISYFHSVQQFVINKGEKPLTTTGVMAFAPFENENYEMGGLMLDMLAGTKEEVRSIKNQLSTKLFESGNANEKNFRNSLNKQKIIHVATHGLQTDSTPLQNHLLFYPGRKQEDHKFHLFELLSMQVESPLVVLSSCNTGAGTFQPGEGVLSLARAFHFAGTPALIMSLWPVDDEVAVGIMEEFYTNIKQGLNLTKSIQKAKCSYIESAGKVKANPSYWASFQLTGYADEIIVKKTGLNSRFIIIGLGVIIILIILLWLRLYLRKRSQSK